LPVRVTVPFFTPTGETEAMADVPGFGPRLQQERERRGWSLEDLAHRSGVSRSQLSRFESGARTNPTRDTLERLSESLGVTIDYLVGRSDTRD
jgi:transcriptional regulator with XRE-family HTH domain